MKAMFLSDCLLRSLMEIIQCPAYPVYIPCSLGGTSMAVVRRRRGRKESTGGYFRKIFDERPELLHNKSNDELIDRWIADHPRHSEKMLKKVRQNLANLKSNLRKKEREGGGLILGGTDT